MNIFRKQIIMAMFIAMSGTALSMDKEEARKQFAAKLAMFNQTQPAQTPATKPEAPKAATTKPGTSGASAKSTNNSSANKPALQDKKAPTQAAGEKPAPGTSKISAAAANFNKPEPKKEEPKKAPAKTSAALDAWKQRLAQATQAQRAQEDAKEEEARKRAEAEQARLKQIAEQQQKAHDDEEAGILPQPKEFSGMQPQAAAQLAAAILGGKPGAKDKAGDTTIKKDSNNTDNKDAGRRPTMTANRKQPTPIKFKSLAGTTSTDADQAGQNPDLDTKKPTIAPAQPAQEQPAQAQAPAKPQPAIIIQDNGYSFNATIAMGATGVLIIAWIISRIMQ